MAVVEELRQWRMLPHRHLPWTELLFLHSGRRRWRQQRPLSLLSARRGDMVAERRRDRLCSVRTTKSQWGISDRQQKKRLNNNWSRIKSTSPVHCSSPSHHHHRFWYWIFLPFHSACPYSHWWWLGIFPLRIFLILASSLSRDVMFF